MFYSTIQITSLLDMSNDLRSDPQSPQETADRIAAFMYKGAAGCAKYYLNFQTAGAAPAQIPSLLGFAANYGALAHSTLTNTGSTVITGNLALSPGTSVTGFPPGIVTGTQDVTNGNAASAQSALAAAISYIQGLPAGPTLSALGGLTLTPGTYTSASTMSLTGNLNLNAGGNPNALFIFQIGSTLTLASAATITLQNGAQARNVYFQVGSSATLGTTSSFFGNILATASVTMNTGASLTGGIYASTGAVTLADNAITMTGPTSPPVGYSNQTFATGTFSLVSSVAGDTVVTGNTTFTEVSSVTTPTSIQFQNGASDTATAANLAAAINANPTTNQYVVATSSGAVVTLTDVFPSAMGNFYPIAGSTNISASGSFLFGGVTGTPSIIHLGL